MATVVNKRQQARNEKTLQELLKQPGNGRCADCDTKNPVSNRRYNPKNSKANIPIDADEVDNAMERFIREKYEHKTLCGEGRPLPSIRQHTGSSSGSSNDIGPPVPAKNAPRLSSTLRSSSAMFTSQNSLPSPPASDWSSNGSRKMAGIPEDALPSRDHSFESKLDQLKGMGFPNETRNSTILKGTAGNMDRAIQTLLRLGEGGPSMAMNAHRAPQQTNGITIQPTGTSQSSTSTNPPPLQQPLQTSVNGTNPFFQTQNTSQPVQPASASALEQSFQNFSISQPQTQQLFPNNTGTWAAQRSRAPSLQNNPFLKTFTPPISPSPYPMQQQSSNPFLRTSQSQTFAPSNPFGQMQQPQQQQVAPLMPQATGFSHQSAPSQSIPTPIQNPMQAQPTGAAQFQNHPQQMQSPQQFFSPQQAPIQSPPPSQLPSSNPYAQHVQQQPQNYFTAESQPPTQAMQPAQFQNFQNPQQVYQSFQQPHPSYTHQRQYYDKNSILALYNTPSLQHQTTQQTQAAAQAPPHIQQRSVTMPLMNGSSNPFGAAPSPNAQPPSVASPGHASRDSMAFMGGRPPSPDAFSGLSARYT
ncbi:MAG: hypothetical protein Q9159_000818 [Coniocarpon cinnabarinum]